MRASRQAISNFFRDPKPLESSIGRVNLLNIWNHYHSDMSGYDWQLWMPKDKDEIDDEYWADVSSLHVVRSSLKLTPAPTPTPLEPPHDQQIQGRHLRPQDPGHPRPCHLPLRLFRRRCQLQEAGQAAGEG